MPKPHHKQTFILLADGFEEEPVSTILTTLREAGLKVNLVGLRAKQVGGAHGLTIVPDLSLDRLLESAEAVSAIILPTGSSHLARLLRDPRLKTLASRLSKEVIFISLGSEAEQVLGQLFQPGIVQPGITMVDGAGSVTDFTQRVAQTLMELC